MGRINSKKRSIDIKIAHKRKAKLAHLRRQYREAKGELEKEKILEKFAKIAPWLSQKEFLASTCPPAKN